MLKVSLGFTFSHGVRARSQPGHHIAIIEFVRSRLDKKHAGLLTVFDRLRRKQNMVLYDDTGFVSRHDAEQALESARDFISVIRADIVRPHRVVIHPPRFDHLTPEEFAARTAARPASPPRRSHPQPRRGRDRTYRKP